MSFARSVTRSAIKANQAARKRQEREATAAARKQAREQAAAAKKSARAEANQHIREADRCVAWAREHGTPEQVAEARAIADEWRQYRDQL